jgi:hypothetical protein
MSLSLLYLLPNISTIELQPFVSIIQFECHIFDDNRLTLPSPCPYLLLHSLASPTPLQLLLLPYSPPHLQQLLSYPTTRLYAPIACLLPYKNQMRVNSPAMEGEFPPSRKIPSEPRGFENDQKIKKSNPRIFISKSGIFHHE